GQRRAHEPACNGNRTKAPFPRFRTRKPTIRLQTGRQPVHVIRRRGHQMRHVLLPLAAIATACLLAACGGNDDSGMSPEAAPPPEQTTPTDAYPEPEPAPPVDDTMTPPPADHTMAPETPPPLDT